MNRVGVRKMMPFELHGAFRKGKSGPGSNTRASSILITVPNNSQTFISTAAYNAESKLMWQENNGIFDNDNVAFAGKSGEWRVTYRIIGSRMMVQNGGEVMADSDEHDTYQIKYTGPDPKAALNGTKV
jgi:hypothetical protein